MPAEFEHSLPEAEPPENLRAEIAAQLDAAEGAAESAALSPVQGGATAAEAPASAAPSSAERARNPDGTFAPKPEAAPAGERPAEAAPAKPELPSTDTAKASEPAASTPADAPPAGWTAEAKAEWSTLSASVKASALKREAEIDAGGRQWSEEKRRYETALAPVAQEAARFGLSVQDGIQRLLDGHIQILQDPEGAIRQIARNHGVNLATLAGHSTAAADGSEASSQYPAQPDIAALVRQHVGPLVAPIYQQMEAQQQAQQQSMLEAVAEFANTHAHFDAVQHELRALVPAYRDSNPGWTPQQVLQAAYDAAIHANATTRQALSHAQAAAAETKRREEESARATRARAAAVSVTGSPSGTSGLNGGESLRETILAAMEAR